MRFLAAILLAAVAASVASADIPPPPPPKGKKYVNVTSEAQLGKDVNVAGWVFVQQTVTGPGRPTFTYSKVELSDKKPVAVVSGGRRNFATLFAVPEATAKEFKTDKELFDALGGNKVKGVQTLALPGNGTVSDAVKGDTVTWTYTITGVDEKGIKTTLSGDGVETKDDKKDDKKPLALAEPGYLVGGIAAALAVTFGGLWLVRRRK